MASLNCFRICEEKDEELGLLCGVTRGNDEEETVLYYGGEGFVCSSAPWTLGEQERKRGKKFGIYTGALPEHEEETKVEPLKLRMPVLNALFLPGRSREFVFSLWQHNKLYHSKVDLSDFDETESAHWFSRGWRVLALEPKELDVYSVGAVECVAVGSSVVAWGMENGHVRIFRYKSAATREFDGDVIVNMEQAHGFDPSGGTNIGICSIEVYGSSKRLATGGSDGKIKLWKISDASLEATDMLRSDPCPIRSLRVLEISDGIEQTLLFGGSDEGCISVWDLKPGNNEKLAMMTHSAEPIHYMDVTLNSVKLDANDLEAHQKDNDEEFQYMTPFLVAGADDGQILLYTIFSSNKGRPERIVRKPWCLVRTFRFQGPVSSVRFEKNGTVLFAATCENELQSWTLENFITTKDEQLTGPVFGSQETQHEDNTLQEQNQPIENETQSIPDQHHTKPESSETIMDDSEEDSDTMPEPRRGFFSSEDNKLILKGDHLQMPEPRPRPPLVFMHEDDDTPPPPPPLPMEERPMSPPPPPPALIHSPRSQDGTSDSSFDDQSLEPTCYDGFIDEDIPPLPLSQLHEPALNSTTQIQVALETLKLETFDRNRVKEQQDTKKAKREIETKCAQKVVNIDAKETLYENLVPIETPSRPFRVPRKVAAQLPPGWKPKPLMKRVEEVHKRHKEMREEKRLLEQIEDDTGQADEVAMEKNQAENQQQERDNISDEDQTDLPWFKRRSSTGVTFPWAREEFYLSNLGDGSVGFHNFRSLQDD